MSAPHVTDLPAAEVCPRVCVVTRLQLRRLHHALAIFAFFLLMRRQAGSVPGLIVASCTIRMTQRRVFIISIWEHQAAFAAFESAVPSHPSRVFWARRHGAKIWSGLFQLFGPSQSSDLWATAPLDQMKVRGIRRSLSAEGEDPATTETTYAELVP